MMDICLQLHIHIKDDGRLSINLIAGIGITFMVVIVDYGKMY